MALFEYRAINKTGKTQKGKIDATSLRQATSKLKSQGLHLVSISSSKKKLPIKTKNDGTKPRRSSIPSKIITAFTRQLSILVSTGIPYDKAFEILIQESDNAAFQYILSSIKAQIVEGSSLAGALQPHSDHFSKMYIAMVRAGEAGGTLGTVLDQLARSREENEELVSKVQGALIYPIVMSIMGMGIVILMVTFIIPKIIPIFQQFEIELPLPTRIVLFTSHFVTDNWLSLIIFIVVFVFIVKRLIKTRKGEKLCDTVLLKLPIFGNMARKMIIFRFTQTLGTLLTSGVELKQSLDIVKYVVGNRIYEDRFDQISTDITKKGMDLSQALRKTALFPLSVIQMIRVGEESSKLEEMLAKIGIIQEKEVKQSLDKTIALLEPMMILGMAFMVGFIVLSVMLPMFKLNQMI